MTATIKKYLKKFGESELITNKGLITLYGSLDKLCEKCLRIGKPIRVVEPFLVDYKEDDDEEVLNDEFVPESIKEYCRKYGRSEIVFNIHLRDGYGSLENLCKECLKKGKTIRELEPFFSEIQT